MAKLWEVQLLGGLQVRSGDTEIPRLADRAERLLFARLALQPRTAHGRDDLAQALWPDIVDVSGHEPRDAPAIRRQRLRRVLSKLNSHFANGGAQLVAPFIADRDTVRLNADAFDIDTERFDRHVARHQWAGARACYRGDLLPGLHDPWIDEQRARMAAAFGWASAAADPDDGSAEEAWDDDGGESGEDAGGPILPYVTRFFGREAETESLRQALAAAHRLVTLLGPGGCGKTRLAAEALRGVRGFEPVAFVALSECMAAEHLLEHLRAALGLTPAARPAIDQIAERLEDQAALLVFDNFEQLVGPAADAVLTALMQRLPLARLLVTSRRSLQRDRDFVGALQPLPLPDGDDSLASAARNAGVMLFVDRARAARSDFTLNARNFSGVIEVCRRLEGLPLAIELAAAKIRSHSPHRMSQALERGLRLLSKSSARVGEVVRHASLEAALAWSWGLLDTMQRDLLCSLSVFRGGWTTDQAQAVAALPAGDRSLNALARDSLLRWQPDAQGRQRLGMLDALREFVDDRLPKRQTLVLRQRHRRHFAALAREADAQQQWPNEADQPNLVQALMTAWADGDDAALGELTSALSAQWFARGAPQQVLEMLHEAVWAQRLGIRLRVNLSVLLTKLWVHGGQIQKAESVAVEALRLAGREPLLRASALLARADVHWRVGRSAEDAARSLALVQEAQSLMPQRPQADAGSALLCGQLLLLQGAITLQHLHDVAGAESLFGQAEQLFDARGDRRRTLQAAPGRVACLLLQAHHEASIAAASNALRLAAELGDVVTQLQLFDRLSSAFDATGQFDRALQACRRQVRLARVHGMAYYAAYGAWNQCHPLVRLDHAPAAARLMAFARQLWTKQFGPLDSDDEAYVDQVRREAAERIGAARLRAEWVRGEALTAREAWALAAGLGADGQADATSN
jgi:predicted ATPase